MLKTDSRSRKGVHPIGNGVVTFHAVPNVSGRWAIKAEDSAGIESFHRSKSDAVARARKLAEAHYLSYVVVHKKDGTVQARYPWGEDPALARAEADRHARIDGLMGAFAYVATSSEEFARRKQTEIDRENG